MIVFQRMHRAHGSCESVPIVGVRFGKDTKAMQTLTVRTDCIYCVLSFLDQIQCVCVFT